MYFLFLDYFSHASRENPNYVNVSSDVYIWTLQNTEITESTTLNNFEMSILNISWYFICYTRKMYMKRKKIFTSL